MSGHVGTAAMLILSILVLLQFVFLLALAQQIGRIRLRLGPIGARMTNDGPAIGALAPNFLVNDQFGRAIQIGGPQERGLLLMFMAPRCAICRRLIPGLKKLAEQEKQKLSVVLISDGKPEDHRHFLDEVRLGDLPYVVSAEVGMAYEAGMTPYGVVLDEGGVVRAKGLCNHMEHVESLLDAWESGFATIQERLRAQGQVPVLSRRAAFVSQGDDNSISSSRG